MGEMDYIFSYEIVNGKNQRGIYRPCKQCGTIFFALLSRIKSGGGCFCSRECFYEDRKVEKLERICKKCGKTFFVFPYIEKENEKMYCCKNCYFEDKRKYDYVVINDKLLHIEYIEKDGKIRKCVKKICKKCGKEFYARVDSIKKDGGLFCCNKCAAYFIRGKNNPNWNGGITKITELYRKNLKYVDWRISCMARDNFTCQKCGAKGCILNVHHIKTVKDIFEKNNIQTQEEWENCEELWDLNNGITLCEKCHKKLHSGGKNDYER